MSATQQQQQQQQQQVDVSASGTQQLLSFAVALAKQGGALIEAAFREERNDHYARKSPTDPVTDTDHAVEALILGAIRARFPQHKLIGEESASEVQWSAAPTWIVDPLDGTANFVHRIPLCAVSIAFTYEKQLIVGVVYNPLQKELYSATHLTRSQLNGRAIGVSRVSSLRSACVATEAGSERSAHKTEWVLAKLGAVLRHDAQCVRMLGSCALNMAAVASGRVDVLYERGPRAWDVAAGALLVRQAGGVVLSGHLFAAAADFDLTARSVLAFTPSLRAELLRTHKLQPP